MMSTEFDRCMPAEILLVDDDPNTRLNFRVTLESEGYKILEAASAARALGLLTESPVALLILDMRMPGMGGLELLARIVKSRIDVPVIIATAHGDVTQAVRAMKLGATDFLQKPIHPANLRTVVAEVINARVPKEQLATEEFRAHIIAAKRCLNLRMFAKAELHLSKALKINDKSIEVLNLTGVLAESVHDYDRARRYYGRAIRLDRTYEPAQQNMRRLFELDHFGSSDERINLGDECCLS
jgi:DNA-binding NtrC family response regulator